MRNNLISYQIRKLIKKAKFYLAGFRRGIKEESVLNATEDNMLKYQPKYEYTYINKILSYIKKTKLIKNNKTNFNVSYVGMRVTQNLVLLFSFLCLISMISYAWYDNTITSEGNVIKTGNLAVNAYGYDDKGDLMGNIKDTPLINNSVWTKDSTDTRYISVVNEGNVDAKILFRALVAGTADANMYWYRLIDVTDQVQNKDMLKTYAVANPSSSSFENNGSFNLANINEQVDLGNVYVANTNLAPKVRYYRIDYGINNNATTATVMGRSLQLRLEIYATQINANYASKVSSNTYLVANKLDLDNALSNALPGDTIKLSEDIKYNKTLVVGKRINFDLNGNKLTIGGNLLFEFVSYQSLLIDLTSNGRLDITGKLTFKTPQTSIEIKGNNNNNIFVYDPDIEVSSYPLADGLYLNNVEMKQRETNSINDISGGTNLVNIDLASNSKLTLSRKTSINKVFSTGTNVNVVNSGTIDLIDFSKVTYYNNYPGRQVTVYNLNNINSNPAILLPDNANITNTSIIKGASANDFKVREVPGFKNSDIELEINKTDVRMTSDDTMKVNISSNDRLKTVVDDFMSSAKNNIEFKNIRNISISTTSKAKLSEADFVYIKDNLINLEKIDLYYANVVDNKIPTNAFNGMARLNNVLLPFNLTSIGDKAFYNCEGLKSINIPQSVDKIGVGSLKNVKYVFFENAVYQASILSDASSKYHNDAIFIVPANGVNSYRNMLINENTDFAKDSVKESSIFDATEEYLVAPTGDGVKIVAYLGLPSSSYVVPNYLTVNNVIKKVTAIGDYAYYRTKFVPGTNLIISNGITSVGDYAFYNQENINQVNLTDVKVVGVSAFEGLTNLAELNLANVEELKTAAFKNNDSLNLVSFNKMKKISKEALANANMIRLLNFTNNVDSNGNDIVPTFAESWLDNSYTTLSRIMVSNNVINNYETSHNELLVEKGTFINNYLIKDYSTGVSIISYIGSSLPINYNVPERINDKPVIRIENNAYLNVKELGKGGNLKMPSSLVSIGNNAFKNANFTNLDLTNTQMVGSYAFANSNFKSVYGINVERIYNGAFSDNDSLKTIYLGQNLVSASFSYLDNVNIYINKDITSVDDLWNNSDVNNKYIVPNDSIDIYRKAWATIKNNVTPAPQNNGVYYYEIKDNAAVISGLYAPNNTSISNIPNKIGDYDVVGIKSKALAGGTATSINLPDSIKYVASDAFIGLDNLTSINLNNDYYKTIDGVLYSKDGKVLIAYPMAKNDDTYKTTADVIAAYAFYNNKYLTVITLSGVESIDAYAFNKMSNLVALSFISNTPPVYMNHNALDRNNVEIRVPEGSSNIYKSNFNFNYYQNMIK